MSVAEFTFEGNCEELNNNLWYYDFAGSGGTDFATHKAWALTEYNPPAEIYDTGYIVAGHISTMQNGIAIHGLGIDYDASIMNTVLFEDYYSFDNILSFEQVRVGDIVYIEEEHAYAACGFNLGGDGNFLIYKELNGRSGTLITNALSSVRADEIVYEYNANSETTTIMIGGTNEDEELALGSWQVGDTEIEWKNQMGTPEGKYNIPATLGLAPLIKIEDGWYLFLGREKHEPDTTPLEYMAISLWNYDRGNIENVSFEEYSAGSAIFANYSQVNPIGARAVIDGSICTVTLIVNVQQCASVASPNAQRKWGIVVTEFTLSKNFLGNWSIDSNIEIKSDFLWSEEQDIPYYPRYGNASFAVAHDFCFDTSNEDVLGYGCGVYRQNNHDTKQYWAFKISTDSASPDPLILTDPIVVNNTINVSNNPFLESTNISIDNNNNQITKLDVFDSIGRLVHSDHEIGESQSIIWRGLNSTGEIVRAGIYFIRVTDTENNIYQTKVIKL